MKPEEKYNICLICGTDITEEHVTPKGTIIAEPKLREPFERAAKVTFKAECPDCKGIQSVEKLSGGRLIVTASEQPKTESEISEEDNKRIELEVAARVRFKLTEIGVRINQKAHSAFMDTFANGDVKGLYTKAALQWFNERVQEAINESSPYQNVSFRERRTLRNAATAEIVERLKLRGTKDARAAERFIQEQITKAQDWL